MIMSPKRQKWGVIVPTTPCTLGTKVSGLDSSGAAGSNADRDATKVERWGAQRPISEPLDELPGLKSWGSVGSGVRDRHAVSAVNPDSYLNRLPRQRILHLISALDFMGCRGCVYSAEIRM